jgi:glucokinase
MDFVLGFDFGGTKMAMATADRSGRRLRETEVPTLASQGAEQALARALDAGRALVDETVKAGGRLTGIGVSTMGITLEEQVLVANNVPGWERLAIPRIMREAFETEAVRVANDVKAAARAELRWGALTGVQSAIYLNLGTGIAAALVIDGQVLEGAHGAAGEIAYNLRHPHEEVGARDGRAPLEEFVGGGAIAARIRRRFGQDATPDAIFGAVDTSGDAHAFVEATLEEIGFHVTNLAIALDPARIAVAGGLMRSEDLVLPRLRAHLQCFVPFPPEVVAGTFTLDGGLMGGIALGLEAAEV